MLKNILQKNAYWWKVFLGIILIWIGWHYWQKHHAPKDNHPITVSVATASLQPATVTTSTIGTVQALRTVEIRAMVNGALQAANFKEGDEVKQDQLILTIDPKPFQAQLTQAKAMLAKDNAQLTNARTTLARNISLKAKGFVSQQNYDDALATVTGLLAATEADQAAIDTANLNLNYCYIKAPFSGRTGALLIQPGNLIKANDTNPIVVINQLDPIDVVFNLPEKYLDILRSEMQKNNLTATIHSEQHVATAPVDFINNSVDSDTGTIQLKARVANAQDFFWPGEFVHVDVPIAQYTQALLIPTIAVQERADGQFVFVVDHEQKVHTHAITVQNTVGDDSIISSGLSPGDQVVTVGVLHLSDGDTVTIAKNA